MPARKRKETAKSRMRRTRVGLGYTTTSEAIGPVMIADGEWDGLFDHYRCFDRHRCRVVRVGAQRPLIVRLEAVGPARGGSLAPADFRICALCPHRADGDDHSALLSLSTAAGLAKRGDGTRRSCGPAPAGIHAPSLCLSGSLDYPDFSRQCVCR